MNNYANKNSNEKLCQITQNQTNLNNIKIFSDRNNTYKIYNEGKNENKTETQTLLHDSRDGSGNENLHENAEEENGTHGKSELEGDSKDLQETHQGDTTAEHTEEETDERIQSGANDNDLRKDNVINLTMDTTEHNDDTNNKENNNNNNSLNISDK